MVSAVLYFVHLTPWTDHFGTSVIYTIVCLRFVNIANASHPTTGPIRFLAPVRFLACKAEWSTHRNFMLVLFSWSHQATGPVWLAMAAHLWFDPIIRRTPHGPGSMHVWVSRMDPARESPMLFISYRTDMSLYGARWRPAGVPYGTLTDT